MAEHHILLPTVEANFHFLPIARISITRWVEIVWLDNVNLLELIIIYTEGEKIKKMGDETTLQISNPNPTTMNIISMKTPNLIRPPQIIFGPLSEHRLLKTSARSYTKRKKPFRNVRATTASFST